jgi:hypothetical protein
MFIIVQTVNKKYKVKSWAYICYFGTLVTKILQLNDRQEMDSLLTCRVYVLLMCVQLNILHPELEANVSYAMLGSKKEEYICLTVIEYNTYLTRI